MKKAIAMAWVADLRNPAFKQGKGRLRNKKNGFCCLGLLCNMHARAHPKIAAEQTNPLKYLGEDSVLPNAVMQWAGMSTQNASTSTYSILTILDKTFYNLASANDRGVKFSDIADWIEKNYKRL